MRVPYRYGVKKKAEHHASLLNLLSSIAIQTGCLCQLLSHSMMEYNRFSTLAHKRTHTHLEHMWIFLLILLINET